MTFQIIEFCWVCPLRQGRMLQISSDHILVLIKQDIINQRMHTPSIYRVYVCQLSNYCPTNWNSQFILIITAFVMNGNQKVHSCRPMHGRKFIQILCILTSNWPIWVQRLRFHWTSLPASHQFMRLFTQLKSKQLSGAAGSITEADSDFHCATYKNAYSLTNRINELWHVSNVSTNYDHCSAFLMSSIVTLAVLTIAQCNGMLATGCHVEKKCALNWN